MNIIKCALTGQELDIRYLIRTIDGYYVNIEDYDKALFLIQDINKLCLSTLKEVNDFYIHYSNTVKICIRYIKKYSEVCNTSYTSSVQEVLLLEHTYMLTTFNKERLAINLYEHHKTMLNTIKYLKNKVHNIFNIDIDDVVLKEAENQSEKNRPSQSKYSDITRALRREYTKDIQYKIGKYGE